MTVPVTVMIPVGPYEFYKGLWLDECVQSARIQTHQPDEILLIDDMAGLEPEDYPDCRIWRNPWRLGGGCSFNSGVALAKNDLVFMLSCDDTMEPDCLEECVKSWQKTNGRDGFYWVGCHYMDGQPDQALPFSAAMVTKGLWRLMGGFPLQSASGAGDAALVSLLMVHFPDRLYRVAGGRPLYNYRVHSQTETAKAGPWLGVIAETRGLITKLWEPPNWGRYEP